MKLEHIVGLGVRLFSIALAIYAVRNGVSLVPYFSEQGMDAVSYLYLGLMAALLLLSVLLWYFPLTVSGRLVTFRGQSGTEVSAASTNDIQIVGLTLLGMYFLFNVLSDIVYWLTIWFIGNRNSVVDLTLSTEQIASMVATFVELLFAAALLLGGTGITKLIKKIRYS